MFNKLLENDQHKNLRMLVIAWIEYINFLIMCIMLIVGSNFLLMRPNELSKKSTTTAKNEWQEHL